MSAHNRLHTLNFLFILFADLFGFKFHSKLLKYLAMSSNGFALFFDFSIKFSKGGVLMIETFFKGLLFLGELSKLILHSFQHLINDNKIVGELVSVKYNAQ